MKYAADTVHSLGMKYAVYNMRELSDRCTEMFPMISMNETLVQGPGGGADWLKEHLHDKATFQRTTYLRRQLSYID